MSRWFWLGAWGLVTALSLRAETISWFCQAGTTNLASSGAPMDASFVFELGVFADGFVPTPSNVIEWEDHWESADQAAYEPSTQRFTSVHQVASNDAPFEVGVPAWILGRKPGAASDQRILFRSSSWLWPVPNPFNPFPLQWNAADAGVVVIGSVDPGGSPFLMRSAETRSYAQWRATELAGEPLDGAGEDADFDGISNLLEFVFGTPPLQANGRPAMPVAIESGHAVVQVPRMAGRPANLWVEVSSDFTQWQSGSPHVELVEETADTLVVRDAVPVGPSHPRVFFRVRASLP